LIVNLVEGDTQILLDAILDPKPSSAARLIAAIPAIKYDKKMTQDKKVRG
jgi:hypothetical protein